MIYDNEYKKNENTKLNHNIHVSEDENCTHAPE